MSAKINAIPRTDEKSKMTAEAANNAEEVKRQLFAEHETPSSTTRVKELPEEVSQAANNEWVKANGAQGVIKLTGTGRTVATVRAEMAVYKLGADAASRLLDSTAVFSLLAQPERKQSVQADWVKANLPDDDVRKRALKLTGEGRTVEAVGADIALAIAGAVHTLAKAAGSELPEEVSQATNNEWVKANGAQGVIKLTGTGRTVAAVRAEMAVYKLGADAASRLLDSLLIQPAATQAAHIEWARANLPDDSERKRVLPLTGEGRTVEAVGADIALAIAGAKHVLVR